MTYNTAKTGCGWPSKIWCKEDLIYMPAYETVNMPIGIILFKRFIVQEACTACSRISYKIVPLTSLNNYLNNNTNETEININISVKKGNENF